MKILFVGPIDKGQTSSMRMEVLRGMGHSLSGLNSQTGWTKAPLVSRRLQQLFAAGPVVEKINSDLLKSVKENKPDLLWAEKQEYLHPETLKTLGRQGIKLLHFTPDPYFSVSWKRTRLADDCMPLYDYALTSKKYELSDYKRTCKQVIYMPLGFAEAVHRPLFPESGELRQKFKSDVAFLGGWGPRREGWLGSVAGDTLCDLKIWGYGWDHLVDGRWTLRRRLALGRISGNSPFKIKKNILLANAVQGNEVYADAYAWALSGARISIGFLSHLCDDQHTTRTFEIPACGSMLLADRSEEHQEFFVEGKEAEFFSSAEELVEKTRFYLKNEESRKKIAMSGLRRCHASGYSYKDRLETALKKIGIFQ